MANKRTLKKSIHLICETLFTEIVAARLYGTDNKENLESLVFSVVKTQRNFLSRVSHPEPGMKASAYYKDLREKFSAQISEISDQLNS